METTYPMDPRNKSGGIGRQVRKELPDLILRSGLARVSKERE